MKICVKCGKEKKLSCFYDYKFGKEGKLARCRECVKAYRDSRKEETKKYKQENAEKLKQQDRDRREKGKEHFRDYRLRKYHNITLDEYYSMLESQEGVCAVCQKVEEVGDYRASSPRALAVDHNHKYVDYCAKSVIKLMDY